MKYSKYNIIKQQKEDTYLVYNSISKASLEINNEYKEKYFDKESLEGLTAQEIQLLKSNDFIIDDNRDEFQEIQYMFNQNYFCKDPSNKFVWWRTISKSK